MKKNKVKGKGSPKDAGAGGSRGQVVKLRPAKSQSVIAEKLASVKGFFTNARQFLAEAVQELKKVTWPGRKETLGVTAVVLFLVFVVAIFLGFVDFGLSRLVRQIIH